MVCNNCGDDLEEGQFGHCAAESGCLTCCTDFVAHCSPMSIELDNQEKERMLAIIQDEAERDTTPADYSPNLPLDRF